MPLMRLYRVSDLLVRHRDKIEAALFTRLRDLFGLTMTVTLFDLTNTFRRHRRRQSVRRSRPLEGKTLGLPAGHPRPGA
jgi:hypothetical protein